MIFSFHTDCKILLYSNPQNYSTFTQAIQAHIHKLYNMPFETHHLEFFAYNKLIYSSEGDTNCIKKVENNKTHHYLSKIKNVQIVHYLQQLF
jgi:hypothetical protein